MTEQTAGLSAVPVDVETMADRLVGRKRNGYAELRRMAIAAILEERARCLGLARQREAICEDACRLIEAGKLYVGIPTALATEGSAKLEAAHIGDLIAGGAAP